ncbi:hypothetical protein OFB99_25570, partial [Escherichia coli]|nr:hypothetical protein [Escherichia coli]
DKSLGDIEEMLNNELLGKTDPAKIKRFERDVNALLRAYRTTMKPDAFEHTKRLMILKFLREDEGIPRLSLFYV